MASQKTVIIVAGPTASGKTALAIRVARHYKTEIISADSRQCFRELNIGVARPSVEQLAEVPHWFIASHSIHDKVTAATFEQYALQKAEEIFRTRDTVVMAGGTGLYLRAFTEGLHEIPEVPPHISDDITEQFYSYGLKWLQDEVQALDPVYFEKGETKNPQRLMRALGVIRSSGRSILEFRTDAKVKRSFNIRKYAVDISKEDLKENIDARVENMISDGLLGEAKALMPHQHLNALQTVGYKELFSYFRGDTNLPDAIASIKMHTRQYAKRQLTWFRNDGGYQWLSGGDESAIISSAMLD